MGLVHQQVSSTVLEIEGLQEDQVLYLGGTYEQTIDEGGLLDSLQVLDQACKEFPLLQKDVGIVERFWRTLIANLRGVGRHYLPPDAMYGSSFRSFVLLKLSKHLAHLENNEGVWETARLMLESLRQHDVHADLPTWDNVMNTVNRSTLSTTSDKIELFVDTGLVESSRTYAWSLQRMFSHRRFFVTAKGRIGIASQGAQVGDALLIAKGGAFPLLMRPSSAKRFQFLSVAYVDGIMHGEAMEGKTFEDIEIE
jgi:hypothetical protein